MVIIFKKLEIPNDIKNQIKKAIETYKLRSFVIVNKSTQGQQQKPNRMLSVYLYLDCVERI